MFIQFMGFSSLVYWHGLPIPPQVDDILSEISTITHPFGVPTGMANSFIEFCKPLFNDNTVIHEGDIHITRPPDLPLEKPECRSGSNS